MIGQCGGRGQAQRGRHGGIGSPPMQRQRARLDFDEGREAPVLGPARGLFQGSGGDRRHLGALQPTVGEEPFQPVDAPYLRRRIDRQHLGHVGRRPSGDQHDAGAGLRQGVQEVDHARVGCGLVALRPEGRQGAVIVEHQEAVAGVGQGGQEVLDAGATPMPGRRPRDVHLPTSMRSPLPYRSANIRVRYSRR